MTAKNIIDKYKTKFAVKTHQELADILETNKNNIDSWVKRGIIPDKWMLILKDKSNDPSLHVNTLAIPKLVVTASCGGGNNLESIDSFDTCGELIIDMETLKHQNGKLKAIKVEGNSMVPTLLPNTWCIFNEHPDFVGEGLYVLNWRNILMVKLLQINAEGKLRIVSTNKDYESYTVSLDEDQSVFRVIGKVVRMIV